VSGDLDDQFGPGTGDDFLWVTLKHLVSIYTTMYGGEDGAIRRCFV
jgi:hypothetical protein